MQGSILPPVTDGGHNPKAGLPVGQEIPGTLGETAVYLHPVTGTYVLVPDVQRLFVVLHALSGEGRGGVVQLLQDSGGRLIVTPLRQCADGPHLHVSTHPTHLSGDALEDPLLCTLHPPGPHDAQAGHRNVLASRSGHNDAQMLHRSPPGLRHTSGDIDAALSPQRYAIEQELSARLLPAPNHERGGSVQGNHVPVVALVRAQVAVAVQIFGVVPPVASGAVRPGISPPIDAASLGDALLLPHTTLVRHVTPDLPQTWIGLLVQVSQAPLLPGLILYPCDSTGGRNEECVFTHRTQVDHDGERVACGGVELDVLTLGEIHAGVTQHRCDRAPHLLVQHTSTGSAKVK